MMTLCFFKQDVVTKPLAKNTLHRMRITGALCYTEIGETAFGESFEMLHELKMQLSLWVTTDADVVIPGSAMQRK
jgi:hypothetical protein